LAPLLAWLACWLGFCLGLSFGLAYLRLAWHFIWLDLSWLLG
jgi:hypothetical protein